MKVNEKLAMENNPYPHMQFLPAMFYIFYCHVGLNDKSEP